MPAAKLNLTVEQEATYRKRLTWRDKNRRAVSLIGYLARMQVRDSYDSETVLLDLNSFDTNGGLTLGGTSGTIDIIITPEQTATLKSGLYDILLTSGSGDDIRLAQGKITVSPAVTRG